MAHSLHQPLLNWLQDDLWEPDGALRRSAELTPLKVNRYHGPRVNAKGILHDFWELGAVKTGQGLLRHSHGQVLNLHPGVTFLVPPRFDHIEESGGNIDIIFVGLRGTMMDACGIANVVWVESRELVEAVEALWLRAAGHSTRIGPVLDGAARTIAADFLRQLASPGLVSDARRVDDVTRYMRMRLSERLAVPVLARQMHCSPDSFRRVFKASLGFTPTEYLARMRLQQAMQLLEHSTLPIAEVARQVGFPDPLYFSRVFHARVGVSPRKYRRQTRP